MRGVVVVVLVSLAYALLCEGEGSGDFIVITPTSKAAPPTDATNDSGSGDDDEDYNNGSGSKPTGTSTVRPTTDSDDEGSGGSGSGYFVTTNMSKMVDATMATTIDNMDIYISEATTAKVITASTDGKTTQITVPSTASPSASTVDVVATETPKTKTPTEKTTTQALVQKSTSKEPKTTVEHTTEQKNDPTEARTQGTSPPLMETTNDPNVLAVKKGEQEEGFTLTTEVIAGVVGCALLALLLIAFLMYRLKKRDEGSYLLDDPYDKKMGNSDKEAFV